MGQQFVLSQVPEEKKKSAVAKFNAWLFRVASSAVVTLFWLLWDAAVRFPRAAAVVYAVGWCLLDIPAWQGSWGWWNAALIAVNPVTVAVVVRAWWEYWPAPVESPDTTDGRVAMWNTVMAAPHEGTNR